MKITNHRATDPEKIRATWQMLLAIAEELNGKPKQKTAGTKPQAR